MNFPILYKKETSDFSGLGNKLLKNAYRISVKNVLNGEYTAEFDLPVGDSALNLMEYDDFVRIDGQLFRIRSMSVSRDESGAAEVHIKCFHVWYDACDCKYIHHAYVQSGSEEVDGWIGVTPRWVLEKAFADTPFFVGDVELDTETDIFATKSNPAEIAGMLIDNVGGFIERDNYTIHLRKYGGGSVKKRIVYGENMKAVEKSTDDSAVITRLYPLGRDDMDISSVTGGEAYIESPLKDIYGYTRCAYKSYPDISDPQKLYEKALSEWSTDEKDGIDKPSVTYTVETDDLSGIKPGDTVRVTDSALGIDILTDVCEVTGYPYEHYQGSIVLSNRKKAVQSISEKVLEKAAGLDKITDKNGNIMSQYIDNVRKKMQSTVDEETAKRLTVHEFGDIWVDNLSSPEKAMVITDALFAVANAKKENGDWDWRTIGTADSFTADSVNADWLKAGYIDTDKITIRSEDGNALLSGNSFIISTPDGFEAEMSAKDGFRYVFSRDAAGDPYDYITIDHKGQKRYWHGQVIPSVYQFSKGTVECKRTSSSLTYGAIELKGAAWVEIARLYNKILNDESLSDYQKASYINSMIQCNAVPIRITSLKADDNAVVLESEFVSTEIGSYTVPYMVEISESGTKLDFTGMHNTFYYDGALMLYNGNGGYIRENGGTNKCHSLLGAYDIAVTLDIDYE